MPKISLSSQRFLARRKRRGSLLALPRRSTLHPGEMQAHPAKFRPTVLLTDDPRLWSDSVSATDVANRLAELEAIHDQITSEQRWTDLRHQVIQSLAMPFGLGKVVGAWDKLGGNVDTIHNVRAGVYATDEEHQNYENRGDYDSTPYHTHPSYIEKGRQRKIDHKDGTLFDDYRQKSFKQSEDSTVDHVMPCNEIHNDPGRVLAGKDGVELANSDSNLATTLGPLNSSKNSKNGGDWADRLDRAEPQRQARIAELSQKHALTEKERHELRKLQQQEEVQTDAVREKDEQAREDYDATVNRAYYTSGKFAGQLAISSVKEGGKMGAQQAFGVILVEFFCAAFDEIRDWRHNGRSENSVWRELGRRLRKVARRCETRLDEALKAGGLGFVSGFFSNIVTTLINAFKTTSQRLVRMIREGLFSLARAARLLFAPPADMNWPEAAHEASKVLLAGGMVIGAMPLEEWLVSQLSLTIPLPALVSTICAAVVGALTAMATGLGVYLLDRLDLFGVVSKRRLADVNQTLDAAISLTESEIEQLLIPD